MKTPIACFIAVMLLLPAMQLVAGGQGEEDVYETTFAHVVSADTAKGQAAERFAELLEERSDGRIRVEVFPDSQLGNDGEITEQMLLGDIEFNAPFTGVLPSFAEQTQLFDLPFAFPDIDTVYDAMFGEVGEIMAEYLQEQGLRTIGFWDGGYKAMTNNVREIRTVDDMQGLRFRVSQSPLLIQQFEAMNASPLDIPFAELFTALQQGTVDGQENTLANIYTRQFFEVQDYMSLTNHGYLGYIFLVSEQFYASLPEDLQQIVDEVALEVSDWQWEAAADENEEFLDRLREGDIQIYEPTEDELDTFRDATAPVYDHFRDNIDGGADLLQALYDVRGFE